MPIHDAYARLTPYELLLPDEDFAAEHFDAAEEEAAERGSDLGDPEQFVMLMAVGEALRKLRAPGEPSERIRQHGALLYHAYHFRGAGAPLWLLTTPAARLVVETAGAGGPEPRPPSRAGYLQLPQHLFWGRAEPDASGEEGEEEPPPQSIDGVFWTVAGDRVSVLAVLGVREDRPGFGVVALPPLPLADAPRWADADMREEGADFRSDMPGAELESLYEIRTAGELLKLLARAFALMGDDARREEPPSGAGGPRPTALPFHRITLD